MLHGANLEVKFWPYAFHHYLRIKNALPSRDSDKSPIELCTGKSEDFTGFRTFGCRVWVRPPGRQNAKLRPNARKGIFLGKPDTTKNIIWYDPASSHIKLAKHARFDEGMNDLPFEDIPPNVQHLMRSKQGERIPPDSRELSVDAFEFKANPLSDTFPKKVKVTNTDALLGMELDNDVLFNRVYVRQVANQSDTQKMFSTIKATRNKIRGAYIISINGEPVFTKEDAIRVLEKLQTDNVKEFEIEFAPEKKLNADQLRKALIEHNIFLPEGKSPRKRQSLNCL
jgi:hypothetical protein